MRKIFLALLLIAIVSSTVYAVERGGVSAQVIGSVAASTAPVSQSPTAFTSVPASTAQLIPKVMPQKQKEIDEVWLLVGQVIHGEGENKVWDSSLGALGWRTFNEVYFTNVGGTAALPSYSEAIVRVALQELDKWKNGLKETDPLGKDIVENLYFLQGTGRKFDSVQFAWSGAFISYILKIAGVNDFPFSTSHTDYFNKIKNGASQSCRVLEMSNVDQIAAGDILCSCRKERCILDGTFEEAHCDIVVSRNGNQLEVVGGNINYNVAKQKKDLTSIKASSQYFGFIRCGAAGAAVITSATNYCGVAGVGTPEMRALLDTIAYPEGGRAYNIIVGGETFNNNYVAHPKIRNARFNSDAAGRYQFMGFTYDNLKTVGLFPDFGPASQDQAAAKLIELREITQQDIVTEINSAVPNKAFWNKLAKEWAGISYSGSDCNTQDHPECGNGKSYYGQSQGKSAAELQALLKQCYNIQKIKLE